MKTAIIISLLLVTRVFSQATSQPSSKNLDLPSDFQQRMAKLNKDAEARNMAAASMPEVYYKLTLREGAPPELAFWYEHRDEYRAAELAGAKERLKSLDRPGIPPRGDALRELREEVSALKNRINELSRGDDVACFPQVDLNSVGSFGKSQAIQLRVNQVIDKKNFIAGFSSTDYVKSDGHIHRTEITKDIWISGIDTTKLVDDETTMLESNVVCFVETAHYTSVGGSSRTVLKAVVIIPDLWLVRENVTAPITMTSSDGSKADGK